MEKWVRYGECPVEQLKESTLNALAVLIHRDTENLEKVNLPDRSRDQIRVFLDEFDVRLEDGESDWRKSVSRRLMVKNALRCSGMAKIMGQVIEATLNKKWIANDEQRDRAFEYLSGYLEEDDCRLEKTETGVRVQIRDADVSGSAGSIEASPQTENLDLLPTVGSAGGNPVVESRSSTSLVGSLDVNGKRIFISHAHLDAELVKCLVELLESCGAPHGSVFCTSQSGQGVPAGTNLIRCLREVISSVDVVIVVSTDNFWRSPACICELGAAWVLDKHVVPLLVPPLSYDEALRGVLEKETLAVRVNDELEIAGMLEEVWGLLDLGRPSYQRWNVKIADYLERISPLVEVEGDSLQGAEGQSEDLVLKGLRDGEIVTRHRTKNATTLNGAHTLMLKVENAGSSVVRDVEVELVFPFDSGNEIRVFEGGEEYRILDGALPARYFDPGSPVSILPQRQDSGQTMIVQRVKKIEAGQTERLIGMRVRFKSRQPHPGHRIPVEYTIGSSAGSSSGSFDLVWSSRDRPQ